MKPSSQSRIFISYAHGGNGLKWKAALLRALHVFEQHHLLDLWQDGRIREGAIWDDDIKSAMNNAQLAVVLLTKETLESQYILNTEFPCLKERRQQDKLPVFPVICEPCDWHKYDWLRATQAPNGANPLSELSETVQAQVFRKLATGIAEELSRGVLAEHSALPAPRSETKTYLDKFPLTRGPGLRQEKLIGREQELALLDLAFAQPHTAIVSLVAWGGVGKTMLVQHWLQRLQREGWFGAQRVYAWSFYSQGTKEDRQTSEDTFLAHALEWFGVQCEPTLSPWDKGRLLADAVTHEATVLILDGIEPLQYPPGPMGGQLRAPGVQSLLKRLARKANSQKSGIGGCLCLVTTRESLTDLADFQRHPDAAWGSVLGVDLGNLTAKAGAALLHHAGANRAGAVKIKADDAELLTACHEVDGHALTLNLLGRFLARAHGGDIRRRDLVKFEEADRQEQGGTTFKMLAAFENWFARSGEFGTRQLAVLRMLGLFDRPADAGCIAALREPPVISGLTDPLFTPIIDAKTGQETVQPLLDEDWNTATSFLADFGLVILPAHADDSECLLDCHPLIREFFAKQLHKTTTEGWRSANRRLYEHLKNSVEYQPATIDALQPLYQAVAHGCLAGFHQEACVEVYRKRILRERVFYSSKKLGAAASNLNAVASFFHKPWSQPDSSLGSEEMAWVQSESAFYLRALGRLAEAIVPLKKSRNEYESQRDWKGCAITTGNLAELELVLGRISSAISEAERALAFAEETKDEFRCQTERAILAYTFYQAGRIGETAKLFKEAESIQATRMPELPLLYSLSGFRFCEMLIASQERIAWQITLVGKKGITLFRTDSQSGVKALPLHEAHCGFDDELGMCERIQQRVTKTLNYSQGQGWLVDVALDRLTLGRIGLYRSIHEQHNAGYLKAHVDDAVTAIHLAASIHHVPCGLLTRSWLRFLQHDASGAQSDLDEAWDIAERGPMRLHLADIHLYRARLFFRENPYPWKSPQEDLAAAEKLINYCGYHRRDEELADAKRAILGT